MKAMHNLRWGKINTDYTGWFFLLFRPKNDKVPDPLENLTLRIFWWDLQCNLTLSHFLGWNSQKNHPVHMYVLYRYPPPDECAKRRCVLGRCLEEKQVCDRVWDCQVSDIGDRNLGWWCRNTANICACNVNVEYWCKSLARMERMNLGATTPWSELKTPTKLFPASQGNSPQGFQT